MPTDRVQLVDKANNALDRLTFVAHVLSDCRNGVIHFEQPASDGLVQIIGDATVELREVIEELTD